MCCLALSACVGDQAKTQETPPPQEDPEAPPVVMADPEPNPDPEPTTDSVAPTIVSLTPLDGAADVASDAAVRVVFSEPLDPALIGDTSVVVSPAHPVTVSFDVASLTLLIAPTQPWAFGVR